MEEFELGTEGHYDILCENPLAEALDLSLQAKECGCSRLELRPLSPDEHAALVKLLPQSHKSTSLGAKPLPLPRDGWQPMVKGEGIPIGPRGAFLLRLFFRGSGTETRHRVLNPTFRIKPEHGPVQFPTLPAVAALVPSVRLYPTAQTLGVLEPGGSVQKRFVFWSSTRAALELTPQLQDPCVTLDVKTVSGEKALEKLAEKINELTTTEELKRGINTRMRSACLLTVTVYEEKDGKQLDLGALERVIPVKVKAGGEALADLTPVVQGQVVGEVKLLDADASGGINLDFSVSEETTHKFTLAAGPQVDVKLPNPKLPFPKLPFVKAKLGEKQKIGEQEVHWELEITIPAYSYTRTRGQRLPSDTMLVLQTTASPGARPRLLRIPVIGSAARD